NFEEAQRRRRLRLLREYLGPMAAQQRDRALQECGAELADLGLAGAEILGDEQGPIAVLVAQLRDGTAQGKANAARALWGLPYNNGVNDATIAAAGAIPLLIRLLRDGTDEGKADAARALCNLAFTAGNQVTIVAAGAIPLLIRLLRDGTVKVKENAAGALANLAATADSKVTIAAAGAIPLLITLLRDGTVEGKENAAGALWNLAINVANRVIIRREGFDVLTRTAAEGPAVVAAKCVRILNRLGV
ncbi:armadillo-type protein, partial [Ochromonadaceae sp. CCMP2298]